MPSMAEDQHLHHAAKPSRQSLVILTIHSTRRPGALDMRFRSSADLLLLYQAR
jgi:hypothetical protein